MPFNVWFTVKHNGSPYNIPMLHCLYCFYCCYSSIIMFLILILIWWYSTLACLVPSSSPQPRFLLQSDLLMWFFLLMVYVAAVPSTKSLAVFEAWEISPVSLFSHYCFLRGSRHPGLWTGLWAHVFCFVCWRCWASVPGPIKLLKTEKFKSTNYFM